MILVTTNYLNSSLATFTKKTTIDGVERKEDEFNAIMAVLENYTPRNNKYIEAKRKLLNNVNKFYEGREKINEGFKNGIFPFYYEEPYEEQIRFEFKNGMFPFQYDEAYEEQIRFEREEEKRRRRNKQESYIQFNLGIG